MIHDCAKFLVLLSGVFVGFAVALVTLLKHGERPEDDGLLDEEEEDLRQRCAFVFSASAVPQTAGALLELVLGSNPALGDCLGGHALAPLVLDSFRALVVLVR